MSHADVQAATQGLVAEMERAVVGKRPVLELLAIALLADGHVLLEDVPGVAKTAIARAVAESAGMRFSRVQFTPDLIPADITGATVLSPTTNEPEFRPGPVFANLVLGDEINRAPPKTQSALLEAMEERQVTADAITRPLPKPFMVIGTQNPIEQEGTYPLPEAQLDRFLLRTGVGYPGTENEVELILRRAKRGADRVVLKAVLTASDVATLQRRVEDVHISQPVARYVVDLVEATRTSARTEAGASPRGSLALLKASRARAAILGRSHVLPDDVKAVAIPCLAHRLLLQPDQWVRGVRAEQVIAEVVGQVRAPTAIEPNERPQAYPSAQYQPTSGILQHQVPPAQPQPSAAQPATPPAAQPQWTAASAQAQPQPGAVPSMPPAQSTVGVSQERTGDLQGAQTDVWPGVEGQEWGAASLPPAVSSRNVGGPPTSPDANSDGAAPPA